ncbi:hypothetical protein [Streptomyces cyaneochromogenes]|uniref:hypothetical protein n=1 Tax=Streptomyces cyaneochromogenes TaxID=2496836 RepID=UPI001E40D3B2|nr:hypothetical protein [Streptomyces cyaneochromogenes]
MTASPIDRTRFLSAAALTAGAAAPPGGLLSGRAEAAVPPQITLPERGIHDTSPASSWTDGFLTRQRRIRGRAVRRSRPREGGVQLPPAGAAERHP